MMAAAELGVSAMWKVKQYVRLYPETFIMNVMLYCVCQCRLCLDKKGQALGTAGYWRPAADCDSNGHGQHMAPATRYNRDKHRDGQPQTMGLHRLDTVCLTVRVCSCVCWLANCLVWIDTFYMILVKLSCHIFDFDILLNRRLFKTNDSKVPDITDHPMHRFCCFSRS